jgi:hypothetical protein
MTCPTYRIKLTPYAPEVTRRKGRDVFRVRVEATDAEYMTNKIFACQRNLLDANTGEQDDEFCFVCSPLDLVAYPADDPDPEQFPQYFRKDTVDIWVPGLQTVQDTLDEISEQVCHLLQVMQTQCELEALEPIWCPSPPDAEPDSSSSSEESSSSSF